MNSYLVFFVVSYCIIFVFFMDFYDISYLTNYPSIYEASSAQSYGLLGGSNAFFSSDNSLSFPYNSAFNSSFDFVLPENAENPQIDALTGRNVYLVWEDYKWSVLYYSSLFIIPAVLTVLYLSPDFMKGLDLSSLFIYLGLIIFALIANNDTRWLLEWAKTISQNSVSLNAIVNTTISDFHNDNMKLKNELNATTFLFNQTLHSEINSTVSSFTHNLSSLDSALNSKIVANFTILSENINNVNSTLDSKVNEAVVVLNNSIIDFGNDIDKMVLKTVHEKVVEDLKCDYNNKIDDLSRKIVAIESDIDERTKRIFEKYEAKLTALENALKTKVNDIDTRTVEAFVEQDRKISLVKTALVSIDAVSQSTGNVLLWSLEKLPAGWVRCDGAGGTPNLLDRFVVSAGGKYKLMDSGGNDVIRLTEGQMFPHTHKSGDYNRLLSVASGKLTYKDGNDSPGEPDLVHSGELQKVGNGDPIDIRPRYAALYFICKNRIT
jgi:hypothetical protein